jgi:hypothetical protein
MRAWFETRPTSPPSGLVPEREENVVAFAPASNGTAEVRIIRKSPMHFSFEIVAWTNFEDAGGNPHCMWHVFTPEKAFVTDSFDTALREANADSKQRNLSIGPFQYIDGYQAQ